MLCFFLKAISFTIQSHNKEIYLSVAQSLLHNLIYHVAQRFRDHIRFGLKRDKNQRFSKIPDLFIAVLWSNINDKDTCSTDFRLQLNESEALELYRSLIFRLRNQPGVVAHACNPATWSLGLVDGMRAGILGAVDLCRSGVRAKLSVNMVNSGEPRFTRLNNEERTGPGWKHSRQKLPRPTVVG